MKLKYKLPIFTVLIAIIPIIAVAVISYNTIMQFSQENYTRIMVNQSAASQKHIQDFYENQTNIATYTSHLDETRDLLMAYENNSSNFEALLSQVSNSQVVAEETNPYLNSSTILDKKGVALASSDTLITGTDFSTSPLYQKVMETGKLAFEVIHDNQNSKDIMIAAPITNKSGKIIGVLQRVTNLTYLNSYIKDLKIGDTGYMYIIDQHGDTLSHYYSNRVSIKESDMKNMTQLIDIIKKSVSGELENPTGFFEYAIEGTKTNAYYSLEPNTNWLIMVAIPESEVSAVAKSSTNTLFLISIIIIIAAGLLGLLLSQSIILPLTNFQKKIKDIASGNFSQRCAYNSKDEFGELAQNINTMAQNLEANEKSLLALALDDELTRMANRKSIYLTMNNYFGKDPSQAVILLDLDGFKNVNDTLGHDFGDKVLIEVANLLKHVSNNNNNYPARLGGDEFMVFVSHYDNIGEVTLLAQTILDNINSIKEIHNKPINISASIGIAQKNQEKTYNDLIKKADEAMYQVKEQGKSGIKLYQES